LKKKKKEGKKTGKERDLLHYLFVNCADVILIVIFICSENELR